MFVSSITSDNRSRPSGPDLTASGDAYDCAHFEPLDAMKGVDVRDRANPEFPGRELNLLRYAPAVT
jgi:hypothetical protein